MAVSAEFLGQQVRCPHCLQVVVAPAASGLDATLAHVPAGPASETDTSVLPPDRPFDSGATENLAFNAPPRLELPPGGRTPPPVPAFDSTLAYLPSEEGDAAPQNEAVASGPEVPDWMRDSAPAGTATAIPGLHVKAHPAQRSSFFSTMFIALVFMPLVLYAVMATVIVVLLLINRNNNAPQTDPREYLIDPDGDNPGVKKKAYRGPLEIDAKESIRPLPANLSVKLGNSLTLGDLQITPERVDWANVKMSTKSSGKPEVRRVLRLDLHLKNVSDDAVFYPMDAMFDRKSDGKGAKVPMTVLVAGDNLRFFGGLSIWYQVADSRNKNQTPRYYVHGNNYEQKLAPKEEMDTFICTDGFDPEREGGDIEAKLNELAHYDGSMVWHVHIRRGSVRWKGRDYPATAVFGVEFTGKDIGHRGNDQ
jgi:hypothetical protein